MLSSMSETKVRGLLDVLPKDASESLKSDLTQIKLTFEETSPDNDDGTSCYVTLRVTWCRSDNLFKFCALW